MALYLDTADVTAWDRLMPTGLFHGITTNPLLASRAGLDYPAIDWAQMATRARDLGAKELHAQVYGPVESYVDWAGALYDAGRAAGIETVVKIPLVEQAIRATGAIRALGGRVLMTACYDAKQMFVANALGADFIAPYFGRMDGLGMDAYGALAQMKAIQGISQSAGGKRCTILVASLRTPEQMVRLAAEGQDTFTISPAVAQALLDDANTAAAYAEFEATV